MAEPVSAGIVCIGGGLSLMAAMKNGLSKESKVTYILGNPFCEWQIMAPYFLVNPEEHMKWVSPDVMDIQKQAGPNAKFIYDVVTEVVPSEKKIKTGCSGELIYDALVIATGQKMPLIALTPGTTLKERQEEVKACGEALKNAKTVVVNGAGLVGLETAGDIKVKYPGTKVILLSRDGKVLGSTHSEKWQNKVMAKLNEMNIEVKKGAISPVEEDFKVPQLKPGKIPLVTRMEGAQLEYDVYIPAYAQGPNTQFLEKYAGVLNDKGQIVANESLQSMVFPEIFGVGVTDQPLGGHPVSEAMTKQAITCVKNAVAQVQGKPLIKHSAAGLTGVPGTITIAHGKNGYLIWVDEALPAPLKICCCMPCGGGFPCCPPPCCWCCCTGCPHACGMCCGPSEGAGPANIYTHGLNPKFADMRNIKGMGKAPPQQEMKLGRAN